MSSKPALGVVVRLYFSCAFFFGGGGVGGFWLEILCGADTPQGNPKKMCIKVSVFKKEIIK